MTNFSYIPERIYTGGQPYFIIVEGAVTEYRDRVAESIAELLPGEYLRDVQRDWPGYKELLYLVRERIPVILSGSHFLSTRGTSEYERADDLQPFLGYGRWGPRILVISPEQSSVDEQSITAEHLTKRYHHHYKYPVDQRPMVTWYRALMPTLTPHRYGTHPPIN